MSADSLDLTFDQTVEDFVALSSFMVRGSPLARRPRWVVRLAYPAVMAAATTIWLALAPLDWIVLAAGCGVTIIFTAKLWNRYDEMNAEQVRKVYSDGRNAALFGTVRLVISEKGIEKTTQYSTSLVQWPAVERIASDGDAIFIFIGAATAHVIPRRAFSDHQSFLDVPGRLEALRAEHRAP